MSWILAAFLILFSAAAGAGAEPRFVEETGPSGIDSTYGGGFRRPDGTWGSWKRLSAGKLHRVAKDHARP